MFTNLETYQSRFWLKEESLKKIGKSSSGFLLELFSRVDALVDQDLVYYDHEMDMETSHHLMLKFLEQKLRYQLRIIGLIIDKCSIFSSSIDRIPTL